MTYYNYTSAGGQFSELIRDRQTVTLFPTPSISSGPQLSPVNGARADLGLYDRIPGADPPDAYYQFGDPPLTLTFEGTEYDAAARVRETNNWVSLTIEEIYNAKVSDVADQDGLVRYNAYDTSLNANWWVVCTERARSEIATTDRAALRREINSQSWPSNPENQPRIAVYRADNGKLRRESVTSESIWHTLMDELALHDQATGNATKASGDALDAAYNNGNGDRNAVAAHDPADPAWGYPPTVELNSAARALLG